MPDQAEAEYPPELARLPPGRHGLPREFVVHNQREHLIAGLGEAVAENGYGATTIAHITSHAAVSRRTFYEHFDSKDACFVAAYEVVIADLRERLANAYETEEEWPLAIHAAIAAMLTFLATEPHLAQLALVEAMAAGPVVVECDAAVQALVPYLQAGREDRAPEILERLSDSTEEALAGGMAFSLTWSSSLLRRTSEATKRQRLLATLPEMRCRLTPSNPGWERRATHPALQEACGSEPRGGVPGHETVTQT